MTISGSHAGISVAGSVVTFYDSSYNAFTANVVGKYIRLTNSLVPLDNKTFYISNFVDSAHLLLQTAFGVGNDTSQSILWTILDSGDGRPLSGAGARYAGEGPAGLDPVQKPSASAIIVNPDQANTAAYFDLATRSFPRDATGAIRRLHWVDQAVGLALGITNGQLGAQTSLGNKLRSIKRNDPLRIEAQVKDAVKVSLKDLMDRKDIVVTNLQIMQAVRSQIIVLLQYINLRTTQVDTNLVSTLSFNF